MKVQSILTQRGTRYILLDDEFNPITDVNKYLKYLDNIGRSPNTQRSYAYNLLLFCQYMSQEDKPLKELCSNVKFVLLLHSSLTRQQPPLLLLDGSMDLLLEFYCLDSLVMSLVTIKG